MQTILGEAGFKMFGEDFSLGVKDSTGALLEIPTELHAGFELAGQELEELIAHHGIDDVLAWAKAGKEASNG